MIDNKLVLCEVGVGPPSMAFCKLVWDRPDVHVIAFEPNREYFAQLVEAAQNRPNVELYNVAIGDEAGTLQFYDEGTSSSLVGVASPSVQHKGDKVERKTYDVQVARISDYDHGQIDILRCDTEGSEFFTLKHLVSRPQEIVVEIYNDLGTYISPYLYEIMRWARENSYTLAKVQDSDFVFHKSGQPAQFLPLPTAPETITHPLSQYEKWIKGTIIAAYTNVFLQQDDPDQFATTLHRIFQRKQKVFANLATYAKREVEERKKPLQETVNNLAFFAGVLREYVNKNANQPIPGLE